MASVALIDSSALINLVHLELAMELPILFDVVYVPRAVQGEVNKKHRFRPRLRRLYGTEFYRPCAVVRQENLVHLMVRAVGEPTALHKGEAETLAQAQEKGAEWVLVDDAPARRRSLRMGLRPLGTVAILAKLHAARRAEDPRQLIRKLRRDVRFHVSDDIVEQAIRDADEAL